MEPPDISIVVVTYNSDSVIADCIAALDRSIEAARKRLSGPPALVLVDNRSTSRPEVRDATTRTTYRVPLERNVGFAPAANPALAGYEPTPNRFRVYPRVKVGAAI